MAVTHGRGRLPRLDAQDHSHETVVVARGPAVATLAAGGELEGLQSPCRRRGMDATQRPSGFLACVAKQRPAEIDSRGAPPEPDHGTAPLMGSVDQSNRSILASLIF